MVIDFPVPKNVIRFEMLENNSDFSSGDILYIRQKFNQEEILPSDYCVVNLDGRLVFRQKSEISFGEIIGVYYGKKRNTEIGKNIQQTASGKQRKVRDRSRNGAK